MTLYFYLTMRRHPASPFAHHPISPCKRPKARSRVNCQGRAGPLKANNSRPFIYPLQFIPAWAIFADMVYMGLLFFLFTGKKESHGNAVAPLIL